MERKQFLKVLAGTCAGVGCCAGALAGQLAAAGLVQAAEKPKWMGDFEKRMASATETPSWRRMQLAEAWIKNLMRNVDEMLDEETKVTLLQANGRCCYEDAYGVRSTEPLPADAPQRLLTFYEQNGAAITRSGDTASFEFNWGTDHQNPYGMYPGNGLCLCSIVESVKEGLSPTFCLCSTGYVREIFERASGKPVTVALLESIKMGGKDCRFKITVHGV